MLCSVPLYLQLSVGGLSLIYVICICLVPLYLQLSVGGLSLIYVICVCLVPLYLQLFVGGLMSYLCYLCLFTYSGVQHILCCVCLRIVVFSTYCVVYLFCFSSSCFFGLSILDCPFGIF
jgi:hypothetical protein